MPLFDTIDSYIHAVELQARGSADGDVVSNDELIRRDPANVFGFIGIEPDPWQADLLRSTLDPDPRFDQSHVLCSRQSGKSQTAAGMALATALLNPHIGRGPATVLIISKALRQSAELLRKVKELYRGFRGDYNVRKGQRRRAKTGIIPWTKAQKLYGEGTDVLGNDLSKPIQESVLSMELENGSRIISLPGSPDTIVGYSAISLLIIDEASRTPDDLYRSLRPMLAVSRGRLVVLSTPFGKRGWFYEAWRRCEDMKALGRAEPWYRVRITADDCPRITKQFLEEERMEIGERWFRQEYYTSFEDTIDTVFSHDDIHATLEDLGAPLF